MTRTVLRFVAFGPVAKLTLGSSGTIVPEPDIGEYAPGA